MYLDHFGLQRLPFQVTPDPQFYFDSAVHRRAMSTFAYGLNKGEGFVVVTGEVGAGKTTLIQFMLNRLDTDQIAVANVNTSQLGADSLIRYVARAFGCTLQGSDKADALEALRDRLVDLFDTGRLPLLIVDEVQALPEDSLEELRMLSNIQAGGAPVLQILLIGQPQFRKRLDDPNLEQLRQRVVASYHLTGLDETEVAAYVHHRLVEAGWDGRRIFDESAVAEICTATQGNPRQINRLCDRLMFNAFFADQRGVTGEDVRDVLADMREEGLLPNAPAEAPGQPTSEPPAHDHGRDQASSGGDSGPGRPPADGQDGHLKREVGELRRLLAAHRTRMRRIAALAEDDNRHG